MTNFLAVDQTNGKAYPRWSSRELWGDAFHNSSKDMTIGSACRRSAAFSQVLQTTSNSGTMSLQTDEKHSTGYGTANGVENLTTTDTQDAALVQLGYKPELSRNRSMYTILFQSLAITAVPFGEGTALTSAIYGGGQLSYFVGWIAVSVLDQCLFMSLSELASKFPTSAGPYYFTYQLLPGSSSSRILLSFVTGW